MYGYVHDWELTCVHRFSPVMYSPVLTTVLPCLEVHLRFIILIGFLFSASMIGRQTNSVGLLNDQPKKGEL